MTALLAILAVLVAQGAPSPPPMAPERAKAVLKFWRSQAITPVERQTARSEGRVRLAREYLAVAQLDPTKDQTLYVSKLLALIAWLEVNQPFDRTHDDEAVDICAAGQLLGGLSVQEVNETSAFFATPTGKRFWTESRIGLSLLPACYQSSMRQNMNGVMALHGVGLKGPQQWEGPMTD